MRDSMLILHFIGLAMGLGTAFAHAFLGFTAAKMTDGDARKLALDTRVLGLMGNIGLGLLLISGIYLLMPYWNSILSLPLLVTKLVLFLILVIVILAINLIDRKQLAQKTEIQYKQTELLGKLALLITIAIVIVAVLVFH